MIKKIIVSKAQELIEKQPIEVLCHSNWGVGSGHQTNTNNVCLVGIVSPYGFTHVVAFNRMNTTLSSSKLLKADWSLNQANGSQ
jgi:hypothetical protein